jgi:hypothetical protein
MLAALRVNQFGEGALEGAGLVETASLSQTRPIFKIGKRM